MKRVGKTIVFDRGVYISAWASAVGKKEGQGPLKGDFDVVVDDATAGQSSWEKAEMELFKTAAQKALDKGGITFTDVDIAVGGDLLNQCVAASFSVRETEMPYLGLYGACSTMAEGLIVGSSFIDGGGACTVLAMAGSHFCSAERQYRMPIEYGGQRTPTAQWTVTGSGSVIMSSKPSNILVAAAYIGKVCDKDVADAANMGAAMAPAAYETIKGFLHDRGTTYLDYDLIVTGDLAAIGRDIVIHLFAQDGVDIKGRYEDCGCLIFDGTQNVHAGGSGCGCSASVLTSYLLKKLQDGQIKSLLFCGTGALLSPTTTFQGESIPGICHLVELRRVD